MIAIQTGKSGALTDGYTHEESLYYSLGPQYWKWTLSTAYGQPWFILLLFIHFILNGVVNYQEEGNWLLLTWLIPMGIYLLWFVAPKPDHYLFPLLIPLFATVLSGFDLYIKGKKSRSRIVRWISNLGLVIYCLLFINQWTFHIMRAVGQFPRYFVTR